MGPARRGRLARSRVPRARAPRPDVRTHRPQPLPQLPLRKRSDDVVPVERDALRRSVPHPPVPHLRRGSHPREGRVAARAALGGDGLRVPVHGHHHRPLRLPRSRHVGRAARASRLTPLRLDGAARLYDGRRRTRASVRATSTYAASSIACLPHCARRSSSFFGATRAMPKFTRKFEGMTQELNHRHVPESSGLRLEPSRETTISPQLTPWPAIAAARTPSPRRKGLPTRRATHGCSLGCRPVRP